MTADAAGLLPGKMLRTRLAARIFHEAPAPVDRMALQGACAATELVHTASLCHDDVVDNAMIRRAKPVLWRTTGPSGAVLIGDVLLCEALAMIGQADGGRCLAAFISKVHQVVQTEAEQELLWLGRQPDEQTCLRLARGKTGPLFAFVAWVCGGRDQAFSAALAEAGYHIGTAYQLADDLLDLVGDEASAGKTLGTDSARGKRTLPQGGAGGERSTRQHIPRLCESAYQCLAPYPKARSAVVSFVQQDLQPLLSRDADICIESSV